MDDRKNIECDDCGEQAAADEAVPCDDCGRTLCGGCRYECGDCHATVCIDCRYGCVDCGGGICENCIHHCTDCDEPVCGDCYAVCENCDEYLCQGCRRWDDSGDCYCESCLPAGGREPYYPDSPAWRTMRERPDMFTVGLEIEVNGGHDMDRMKDSGLIAGWCSDLSLDEGLEYQTRILTAEDFDDLCDLIAGIRTRSNEPGRAGGHMHVRRTSRQTPGRWYWALKGLADRQARALNMRHTSDCRWCELTHGDYTGKFTAVNDNHYDTIELRTFARWDGTTAHRLRPALEWAHHMWRYFQEHEPYRLTTAAIMRESAHSAYRTPETTPAMRLAARKED